MGNCLAFVVRLIAAAQRSDPEKRALVAPEEGLERLGNVELQLAEAHTRLEDAVRRQNEIIREIHTLNSKVRPNDVLAMVKLRGLRYRLITAIKHVHKIRSLYIEIHTTQSNLEAHAADQTLIRQTRAFQQALGPRAGYSRASDEADDAMDDLRDRMNEIKDEATELNDIISSVDPLPDDLDQLELGELLERYDPEAAPARLVPPPSIPLPPPRVSILEPLPTPVRPTPAPVSIQPLPAPAPAPPLVQPLPPPSIPQERELVEV